MAVLHDEILSGKQSGEIALDFGVEHRSLSVLHLVYDKGGAEATPPLIMLCNNPHKETLYEFFLDYVRNDFHE